MKKLLIHLLPTAILSLPLAAQAEEVTLTSLEWPPYTSESIAGNGMTSVILKQALALEGYDLKIEFEPWETAVSRAFNDENVVGYFPEYHSASLEEKCVFSDAIGTSLVVFGSRKGERYPSNTLEDITTHKVGVVSGYVNEEKFDQAVSEGMVAVKESVSDVENIENLLNGLVDLIVIDQRVLKHWLMKSPSLSESNGQVKYNPGGLKMHGLYVCFTGDSASKYADALSSGLKKLDPMGFGLQNDPMYKHELN